MAYNQGGEQVGPNNIGVAQNAKNAVRCSRLGVEIKPPLVGYLVVCVNDVAQGGKQVLADAVDNLPIDKGRGWRILDT